MRADRNAAKHVLRFLDNPDALEHSVLFEEAQHLTGAERRAAVLRALDRLDPGAAQHADADRRRRKHAILTRCDVHGEPQETVANTLGLSMRQFYRERSEAFEEFAIALRAALTPASPRAHVSTDMLAMRERLIQKLRGCGEHARVWSEAAAFAFELGSDERAIEFWTVAAEAARYMGDLSKSASAIEQAKRVLLARMPYRSVAADILIAIPEMALDWTHAKYVQASDRLEEIVRACGYGKTLVDLDATLFGIMLTYGISVEIERGRWERANVLLRHLQETGIRSDASYTSPSLRRHAGRVALRGHCDRSRAVVELREALASAQRFDNLAAEASASVDLGIALAGNSCDEAVRYIDYGLAVARKVLGRNEFAMLMLSAIPALRRGSGLEKAREVVAEVAAMQGLAERAHMALDLAQTAIMLHDGKHRAVIERAEALSDTLERSGLHAPAEQAIIIGAIAYAKIGRGPRARRMLCERIRPGGVEEPPDLAALAGEIL